MFRGRYAATVDAKGRVSIPAKFREVLSRYESQDLVLVPDGECLEVYPLSEWERAIEVKLREKARMGTDTRDFSRLYVSRGKDARLDAAGRLLVDPEMRKELTLERNVTILGGGLDKFEIWDRARFEEYERTGRPKLPELFEKMAASGV